ncbi:MAG: PspC domain-containing protein [Ruthenibacterium sp.]
MEPKRLYKSSQSRMLCGVCGGIAEYFNVDPTLVRLLCVLLGCTGTGLFAYIVAAVVIPQPPQDHTP